MTIVFSDNFTETVDRNIDAYPSGAADYAYNLNSGNAMFVSQANDRVDYTEPTSDVAARIIDAAGAISGDQEIIGTIVADNGSGSSVHTRCATSGNLGNWYSLFVDSTVVNESQLYRFDNGAFNLLADADVFNGDGSRTGRLRATGAGATVTLTWQINATATQTFNDTNANRKTTGVPGIGGYSLAGAVIWLDTITVDDLASAFVGDEDGLWYISRER